MDLQEQTFVQDATSGRDACLILKGSMLRSAVLTLLFFTMLGGIVLLILLANQPYAIQITSVVIDTAAVAVYTFSRNGNNVQRFLLSCPIVHRQIPTLIRRHLVFLAALILIQTTALELRPNLPEYLTKSRGTEPSPFAVALGIVFGCLAVFQILSNRSLLERAHRSAETKKTGD